MASRLFWVKDDGSYEEVGWGESRKWVRLHPNKAIKMVEVFSTRALIYSLSNDGNVYDFDGASIGKNVLVQILKETV